ncbi:hypothetical protein F0225_01820 [Vibrio pectenicida]|uniref:Uncharacterized protein n=1 Tax=Vibrio pectenicida TaxID=62763 RepID=A0A3R9F0T6_9VIBR|nr:hypothetical protein [Vibrio pectenicida]NOH70079.1 hypothetical protein [Vibrio pectenicida]RSD26595.1 hypothetical protein EJA03_20145 [Vibrio pectenicida]
MNPVIITTMVSMILLMSSAVAATNPNIEFISKASCKIGGCKMVCTTSDGKSNVKAQGINSAEIITYKSGTVQHNLVIGFQKMVVTSPSGTESCSLNNIEKITTE